MENIKKQTVENGMNHIQNPFQRLFMETLGTKTGSLLGKSISHKADMFTTVVLNISAAKSA